MLERVTAAQALQMVVGALRGGADFEAVLGTLLAEARAMLEADEAYVMLREAGCLRLRASIGLPIAQCGPVLGPGEGIEGRAIAEREPVIVSCASRDPRHRDPFGRQQPVGAMAVYPLVLRDEVRGVIVAARRAPGRFGGADLWWLDLLGGLAATLVEGDLSRRAQERRARQAETLAEIDSLPIGAGPDRLRHLTATLSRGLGVEQAAVYLVDPGSPALILTAAWSSPGVQRELATRIPLDGDSPQALAYREGAPAVTVGRWSVMAMPITASGEKRGVLHLAGREEGALTELDQGFLQMVAARVGMMIEEEELVTRRLELERERAEADARQAFVGIVSHELKTPVAVIQAYTDLLLRRAERTRDVANVDVLRRIGEQADRMLGLIDQLLDIQRLEAGLFSLEPSRFDLVALARRVSEETEAVAQPDGVSVAIYADPPKIQVTADRRRIEEVLQNLLQNAVKYGRAGDRIEVRLRQSGDKAVVSVRDRGIGIQHDELARIFDRFYQGRNRLGGGHVGLGLGLYISREIVRRHGGEIWAESTLGAGSTFHFSLPLRGPEGADR